MSRFLSHRLCLGALLVVMLVGTGVAEALIPPIEFKLPAIIFNVTGLATSSSDWDYSPEIDGKLIAWTTDVGGTHTDYGIKVRNLDTGVTRLIGFADGKTQGSPDVSGEYVVFHEYNGSDYDIKRYSWEFDNVSTVRSTANDEGYPRIDGNLVVWGDGDTGYLWYRDYDMAGTTAAQVPGSSSADNWDVDNGRIVWEDLGTDTLHLYTPRAPGDDGTLVDYVDDIFSLNVHGDRVAFTRRVTPNDDALYYDLRTGETNNVAVDSVDVEQSPVVFHNTFAWLQPGLGDWGIGYSRPAHWDSAIDSAEEDYGPSLYGHRIAYSRVDTSPVDYDAMLATGQTKLMGRTYGSNRYATAANVSKGYFSEAGNVVLCTGENFPDALSAAPLARALEAPLLLTRRDSLPSETLAEITRLKANKVYIIGSSAAVSSAVFNQIDALNAGGMLVERIQGVDRYDTSAKIAARLQTIMGDSIVFRAFFARGDDFPDALAVGPVAAGAFGPVLLVKPTSVPTVIQDAVDDLDITLGYIIGSPVAISDGVRNSLADLIVANGAVGTITERWAGDNRYETAAEVIKNGLDWRWIDLDTLGIATGLNFPDALGGGAALGYYGSPVMLTYGYTLSPATSLFLTDHEYEIGRVDVFGGSNVVSSSVYDAILAKLK